MPDLIRHPVILLDSAILHYVPGLAVIPDPDPGRNDKRKVFIRRFNILACGKQLRVKINYTWRPARAP
jgi:hypothetical protein